MRKYIEKYDNKLVAAFVTALSNSFSSLKKTYNEQFYYYAFIFDSGLYPYISTWSYEALEKAIVENKVSGEDKGWWKWDYSDSPYVVYGYDEFFGEVKELLDKRGKRLSMDELYGAEREKVVINVEIAPPDGDEYYSALCLNPESSLLFEYLKYCEQPRLV